MRRLSLTCMVLAAVLALSSPAYAATAAEYRERVLEARSAVEEALPGIAEEPVAHALAAEVDTLLPTTEVVEVGGTGVTVDNSGLHTLVAQLQDASGGVARRDVAERILEHLVSQEAAVGVAGTAPPSDPAALSRILEDEGLTEGSGAGSTLLARLQEIVNRIIEWLMNAGGRPAVIGSFRVVYYVLLVLSGFAVIWIATLIVRRLRSSGPRGDSGAGGTSGVPAVAAAEGLPDDALAFADAEAASGRFREAVRALFGGAARDLVERGVVSRARTRTTCELLGDVEAVRPSVMPPLRTLASAFEPAWYGHVDPGASGYADARAVYVSLAATLDPAGDGA
jgi:hypothetical protein